MLKKLIPWKRAESEKLPKQTVHVFAEAYYDRAVFTKIVEEEAKAVVVDRREYPLVDEETENIMFSASVFISAIQKFAEDCLVSKDSVFHLILSETHLADSFYYNYEKDEIPADVEEAALAELEVRLCGSSYANEEIILTLKKEDEPERGICRGVVRYMRESIVNAFWKEISQLGYEIAEVSLDTDCLVEYLDGNRKLGSPGVLAAVVHAGNYGCVFAGISGNSRLTMPVKYGMDFYVTQGERQFGMDVLEFMSNFIRYAGNEFNKVVFFLSGKAEENQKIMDMLETFSTKDGQFVIFGTPKTRPEEFGLVWPKTIQADSKEVVCGAWKNHLAGYGRSLVVKAKKQEEKRTLFKRLFDWILRRNAKN